ncbi:alanine racemase [Granulicella sp. WH15]|uniref:alanine racemase n=1 Tax=Granulicella sp. WH15 TaxID=2602070 RepID=UPI0013671852|nr:alanine racemase [Granulicella sp. WH15]QHN05192.1 alanine racemase [Granulicella sp. WH15]
MNNWIEISEQRLADNYRALVAVAGVDVLAVIKANAYGHGAARCAPMLARAGAGWLGVTSAREGAAVRQALVGTDVKILVMSGFLPEDVALLVEHRLTPVVWTSDQLGWLGEASLPVHVEIDTGMSRQGVEPGPSLAALLDGIAAQPGLRVDGVFTHYSSSEVAESPVTLRQQHRFEEAIAQLAARGLQPDWVHAGNTSTVDNPVGAADWLMALAASVGARAMVRTGLGLYGYCLEIEPSGEPHVEPSLKPVMTWKTRVLSARELAPGESVGYNGIWTANEPVRVALLPVGYADGWRRELSATNQKPGGWAMIAGQRAPILGRISMNLTVVDVTGIAEVKAGDEAVVLGDGVTAEDHARLAGTISYEILCGVHPCG